MEKKECRIMVTDIFDAAHLAAIPVGHSFLDKESRCKRLFEQALRFFGPFYHLHTPEDHPVIFRDPEVYAFAMTVVAMCAHDCPKIRIITFELMSNHVHFVICGERDDVLAFFELFKRRLKKYLESREGRLFTASMESDGNLTIKNSDMQDIRNENESIVAGNHSVSRTEENRRKTQDEKKDSHDGNRSLNRQRENEQLKAVGLRKESGDVMHKAGEEAGK